MSETNEILTVLAALSDDELAAVLRAATAGRPAFRAVQAALLELGEPASKGDDGLAEHEHLPRGDAADAVISATVPVGDDPPTTVSGQVSAPVPPVPPISATPGAGGYTDSGVPTLDAVRDKVDRRFGTAQGMGELDRQTPVGRSVEEQFAAREEAARERLDRIRRSLRDEAD